MSRPPKTPKTESGVAAPLREVEDEHQRARQLENVFAGEDARARSYWEAQVRAGTAYPFGR